MADPSCTPHPPLRGTLSLRARDMPKTFLQSFLMDLAKSFAAVLRPTLVLLLAFLIFGSVILAYQAIRTLQQLNAVEAERDDGSVRTTSSSNLT